MVSTLWSVQRIHLYHLHDECFQFNENRVAFKLKRGKAKRRERGITSREQLMEGCTKAIEIGTCSRLGFAILFGGSIAWRTKRDSIPSLSRLEMACNAKIDQEELPTRSEHDIRRF